MRTFGPVPSLTVSLLYEVNSDDLPPQRAKIQNTFNNVEMLRTRRVENFQVQHRRNAAKMAVSNGDGMRSL